MSICRVMIAGAIAGACWSCSRPNCAVSETQVPTEAFRETVWDCSFDPRYPLCFPVVAKADESLFIDPVTAVRVLAVEANGKNIDAHWTRTTMDLNRGTRTCQGPCCIYLCREHVTAHEDGTWTVASITDETPTSGKLLQYRIPKSTTELRIKCCIVTPSGETQGPFDVWLHCYHGNPW
jgi:hypothetical protein